VPIKTLSTAAVLTLVLLSACAQPPTAELEAAEAALASAREAGAAEYLPSLVEGAEVALDSAREAIEGGRFDEARGFLTEATTNATEAVETVGAAKDAVGEQLAGRIDEIAAEIPIASEEIESLEKCPKSKKKNMELDTAEVRSRLEQVSTDLDGVRASLQAGDYLAGLTDVDAAGQALDDLRAEVTTAKAAAGC
jgi:hypothetical protein